jgi:hypothetical protein
MRWVQSLKILWRRRQLLNAVVATLEQGAGVSETCWPQGTDVATVLGWFDAQLAAARRPYGFQACILAAGPFDAPVATIQYMVGRSRPWLGSVRDMLAADLAPLLAAGALKTATVALGSAVYAALPSEQRAR